MPDIYNKVYNPISEVSDGQRTFKELVIDPADLGVGVPYTSRDLEVNFRGWTAQAWNVLVDNDGAAGPGANVEIQEYLPYPGYPCDGDPTHGVWATKGSLGVGVASANILFEHNQEDIMRLSRLLITPTVSIPVNGIRVQISGRR